MKKSDSKKRKKLRKGLLITTLVVILAPLVVYMIFLEAREKAGMQKTPEGFEVVIPGIDVNALVLDGQEVWAGGLGGLYLLDGDGYQKVSSFHYVKALLPDPPGGIWVGHNDGLSLVTENTKGKDFDFVIKTYTTSDGLPDKRINALAFSSSGDLLVGSWGGLTGMKDGKFKETKTVEHGLIDNMVNTIFFDRNENMWLGSYVAPRGGITVFPLKANPQQFPAGQDGLVHPNIIAMTEPFPDYIISGGGLFTKGGGNIFSRLDGQWQILSEITTVDGVPGEKIRSLYFDDSTGDLWVGTEYDGLVIFKDFDISKDGKITYSDSIILTVKDGLPNNEIKVIHKAPDGAFWIGTRTGLLRIKKGGLENAGNNK